MPKREKKMNQELDRQKQRIERRRRQIECAQSTAYEFDFDTNNIEKKQYYFHSEIE